jgi:hypothetical protein
MHAHEEALLQPFECVFDFGPGYRTRPWSALLRWIVLHLTLLLVPIPLHASIRIEPCNEWDQFPSAMYIHSTCPVQSPSLDLPRSLGHLTHRA